MSSDFYDRLSPLLDTIAAHFGTPFHIYDEQGIRDTGAILKKAFSKLSVFREYYAVKALPNPSILSIMKSMGFGFDCSSIPELMMSRSAGASPSDIMFTSNNTHPLEFTEAAAHGGCILNLDDISLIPKAPEMPELICFRYNPGSRRTGNSIIGNPIEAKYGVAHDQIVFAYEEARKRGAKRFGLHTMLASNERNYTYMVETTRMLIEIVEMVSEKSERPLSSSISAAAWVSPTGQRIHPSISGPWEKRSRPLWKDFRPVMGIARNSSWKAAVT
jgi:diaminopimelate decarboxylase